MQRPAKPWTSVRFRAQPPYSSFTLSHNVSKSLETGIFFARVGIITSQHIAGLTRKSVGKNAGNFGDVWVTMLTALQIKAAEPRDKLYRLADGNGLYLEIPPKGAKRWRFRYRYAGREKMLSLGTYPEVSLKSARRKLDDARALLAEGTDPSAARQLEKRAAREAAEGTFAAAAESWRDRYLITKSPAHQKRSWSIIERCLLPYIGPRPIREISAPEILQALRVTEERGRIDTAHRALQLAGQIFRYAVAHGWAEIDPTPSLRGALSPVTTRHMPAPTDPVAVGGYLRMIDAFRGTAVVAAALKLLPLLFCRPGELRTMRWAEVDLEAAEWRYTASKTQTDHLVPLSRQAVDILASLHPLTSHLPGGWVFPGERSPLRPMSEAAMNAAYRRMGIDTKTELTPHGWRATARTLLHEQLEYPPEVIEQQLAHAVPDTLGRAYNRTRFADQRREMMQAWADHLDKLKTGADVVEITKVRRR